MRFRVAVTLTVAIALGASPAMAQKSSDDLTDTAGGLRASCLGTNSSFPLGVCAGFLDGVRQAMENRDDKAGTKTLCRPVDSPRRVMLDAFLNYMKLHPDAATYGAASVVEAAYIAAWGCSNKV